VIDQILENFRDQIEAIAPDDKPDIPYKRYDGDLEKAARTPGNDRKFVVFPDEAMKILSPASPATLCRFEKAVLVMLMYRVGKSMNEFIDRVHKDVDRIAYTLRNPSTYGRTDDWALLGREPLERFFIDFDEVDKSATVTIAFKTIYSVSYA